MSVSSTVDSIVETESREYSECSQAVTCPICYDPFVDGRRLSCSHTFCLRCLREYRKFANGSLCPTCRVQTVPASSELHRLPAHTFANAVASLLHTYQFAKERAQVVQKSLPQTVPQQQYNNLLQLQSQQLQVVWQGSLEFCERRASMVNQADRMLLMQAKFMADANVDNDLIISEGLFKWPQKISIYPIPELILTQSPECKRQLSTDSRKLNVVANSSHDSPFRSFANMLVEKGMFGVVNMNAQHEYQIMLLFPLKNQAAAATCAMKALLPRQQAVFYEVFKKSVQAYKDKIPARPA